MADAEGKREAEYAEPERGSGAALAIGLGLFGLALGFTTAISTHEGISSELLSGLFSFVGGSVLTYGGFRYARRGAGAEAAALSPLRVGLGVAGFSLGVLVGQPLGIAYRWQAGARVAAGELEACRDRARNAPDLYRAGVDARCFGVQLAAPPAEKRPRPPAPGGDTPPKKEPGEAARSEAAKKVQPAPAPPRETNVATAGVQPAVAVYVVGPQPAGLGADTHAPDTGPRSDAGVLRDECRRIQGEVKAGAAWTLEGSKAADALRVVAPLVDCAAVGSGP